MNLEMQGRATEALGVRLNDASPVEPWLRMIARCELRDTGIWIRVTAHFLDGIRRDANEEIATSFFSNFEDLYNANDRLWEAAEVTLTPDGSVSCELTYPQEQR